MKVFETETEAATCCYQRIKQIIAEKPSALICLAAGHTSLPLFDRLIAASKSGEIDFSQVWVVGLDEWAGLSGRDDGSCENFLRQNIFDHIGIADARIRLFDGKAEDLAGECAQIERFIRDHGGIDYMLLGVGMNGHLGLNEPGTEENSGARVVKLDGVTKTVADKYFKQKPKLSEGVTLGIKNIKEAKTVQVLITGAKKSAIVKRIADTQATGALPATLIKGLDHVEFVIDKQAASLL